MTLADFLFAHIADEEQAARDVLAWPTGISQLPERHHRRVLVECEVKGGIVAEHSPVDPCVGTFGPDGAPCPTLRLLALLYADYPGYRPEWRP